MMATSVLWYVLQEAMTTMVDCNKGAQDCTTQHPTIYFCHIAGEQAMIAKAKAPAMKYITTMTTSSTRNDQFLMS
jgi:hypothetical protein